MSRVDMSSKELKWKSNLQIVHECFILVSWLAIVANLILLGRGASIREFHPSDWSVALCMGHFLDYSVLGRAQPTTGVSPLGRWSRL